MEARGAESAPRNNGELVVPLAELDVIRNIQETLTETVATIQFDTEAPARDQALHLAHASQTLRAAAEALLATAGTIGVLNGGSVRSIASEAGIRHATMRRALARSTTLQEYATGEGTHRAVTTEGIASAHAAIKDGRIASATTRPDKEG